MRDSEQRRKAERKRNAGGVAPNAKRHALKLLAAIIRLKQRFSVQIAPHLDANLTNTEKISPLDRALLLFLYLWLINRLPHCHSIEDIPDLRLVSGRDDCDAYRLRKIRKTAPSWVEYAMPHRTPQGTEWRWQPIPNGLNHWFVGALAHTKANSQAWHMSEDEKRAFLRFLQTKWRTPVALKGYDMMRRDHFYHYIDSMMHRDPHVSVCTKYSALQDKSPHHNSAPAYQSSNTNAVRYELFHAQGRYLSRLHQAMPSDLLALFCAPEPVTGNDAPLFKAQSSVPAYLATPGEIVAFRYAITDSTREYLPIPAQPIGSTRQLLVNDVRQFFARLANKGRALEKKRHTTASLRELHNFRAYELALLLIALTGTRPTHAISLEKALCFDRRSALVFDKGIYRTLYLCPAFERTLRRYLSLQRQLADMTGVALESPYLWFTVTEAMSIAHLNAQSLRQFMSSTWQSVNPSERVDPYQLRHFFAQHALNSLDPVLTAGDIDRLMGHANFGEQLGSDVLFPAKQRKLHRFLDKLPDFLHLSEPMEEYDVTHHAAR